MSIPLQTPPTPAAVYQSHFGALPGTNDARTECEKWERLCGALLAERERLRAELDKASLEKACAEWEPIGSMQEVYAQVDRSRSLHDIVADMEKELGTDQ